jgi:hypothetical protein
MGLPSSTNKYIFNGDFVDRGSHGAEVMCVLLALLIARPDCVALNRGNHEDFSICSVYGFQLECYEKYDPLTFGLFVEVFQVSTATAQPTKAARQTDRQTDRQTGCACSQPAALPS